MKIKEVRRYGKKVLKAINKLLPQLDPGIESMTKKRLKSLLRSENSHLFIAETQEGEIAGMLTAVVYLDRKSVV